MVFLEGGEGGERDAAVGDGGSAADEAVVVDEGVGEGHDVGAHAVLVGEVGDGGRVEVGERFEEGDVEAAGQGGFILDEGGELVVVTDEDEGAGHADGAQADGERDLGGFVYDAVVENALVEDRVVDAEAGGGDDLLGVAALDVGDGFHWFAGDVGEFLDLGVDFGEGTDAEDSYVVFAQLEEDVVNGGVSVGGE